MNSQRINQIIALLGTVAIIAFVPTNLGKAAALLVLWLITFRKLNRAELVLYGVACVFFTVMDVITVRAGQFHFDHPDFLGIPIFEPLMWGFYLLHTWRMVQGPVPDQVDRKACVLFVLFAAPFVLVQDHTMLFVLTGAVLVVGLATYRQRLDWTYVLYMIFLGAVVEYAGVFSGQWHYPGNPATGVPLWFATMWGGLGLFLRRMVLPCALRFNPLRTKKTNRTTACETGSQAPLPN